MGYGFIAPVEINMEFYHLNYPSLPQYCLEKNILLEKMYSNRSHAKNRFLLTQENRLFLKTLLSECQGFKDDILLLGADLQTVGNRIAPLLKKTEFNWIPDQNSSEILKGFFRKDFSYNKLSEIIEGANLSFNDLMWRAGPVDGQLKIFGTPDSTPLNVLAFAHEIGHVFYELVSQEKNIFKKQIQSEIFAVTIERLAADCFIENIFYEKIIKYQKSVQFLNVVSFAWELIDLGCDIDFKLPPFDRYFLVMRETLFSYVGYQALYVLADLVSKHVLEQCRERCQDLLHIVSLVEAAFQSFWSINLDY